MFASTRALALSTALLLSLVPAAHASHKNGGGQDRVGLFTTINIAEDRPAGDVACMFCTVNVDGDIHGDVAVLFGTVNGSAERTISGDVAVLFSTLRLGENSAVKGDLASAFSTVDLPSSASVAGDRAIFATGLGAVVVTAPLLLLIGIVWLVVHLVRENRSRYQPYPPAPRRY